MKILVVLGREPTYVRHDVMLEGWKRLGVEVTLCASSEKNFVKRTLSVSWQFIKNVGKPHDFTYVGFLGQHLMPLVFLLERKPIVFDAWLSTFETAANARKWFNNNSIQAKFLKWLDRFGATHATATIFPSNGEMDYYVQKLGLKSNRFHRVIIGANTNVFHPVPKKKTKQLIVEFHGTFLPISGVGIIVEAANLLKKDQTIHFRVAGNGETFEANTKRAKELGLTNIEFVGPLPYKEIPSFIAQADVSLGIFGESEKTKRIMTTKVFEAIAMKKPVINAASPGVEEILTDGQSILLVPPDHPKALANAILKLKKSKTLRNKIAANAYHIFCAQAAPEKLAQQVIDIVQSKRSN